MKNKSMFALALIVIASMALAACQPQTIVQTVVVETTKEVQVIQTQVVEQTSVVEVQKGAFTTPNPILGDLKVRQAMAYCTNKADLAKAGYPLLTDDQAKALVMDTFIPKAHWAYAGDENVTIYPFDVAKGSALLEEAGWTIGDADPVRSNADGTVLALKFYTTTAAFRQAWAAVWEKQMADCGIQILRSHVPSSWWFGDTTGLAVRDFEIGAFAWVGQADPGGVSLWACDQIPLPENNWVGQNYMGWCNETASAAIKNANNTLDQAERKKWFTIVQQEYTKDVPAIPIFNRTETSAANANLVGFAPTPGEEYYTWNVQDWEIPGKDTIVLGTPQEPASLYTLVESGYSAVIAAQLMGFRSYTSLNYAFQPELLNELPTIENGGALNNDVEAKEGDMVYDSGGNVVALAAGVKVIDATGAEVEYSSGTVKMKQLVVTYKFREDIKWQDGSSLSQADLELAYKTTCDHESGATTFINCDKTANITFDGTSETVTLLPGVQDPLYSLPYYTFYPLQSADRIGRPLQGYDPQGRPRQRLADPARGC